MGGAYQRASEVGDRKPNDWGGYAYGNEVTGPGNLSYGYEGGFGLDTGLIGDKDGWNARSQLLTADGFVGAKSQQEADGSYSAWHGIGASGKVAQIDGGYGQPGEGWYAQGHAEAFTAEANAQFNEERGIGGKIGADIVGADVAFGHLSKDSGHDQTAKFGVSAGVGIGGGLHWADEDGDGIREIGVNGSIKLGPGISFDLRSETLGQGYKYLEDNVPAAWDWTKNAAGDVADWAGDTWNQGSEAVGNAWDATKQGAGDLWDGAKSGASNAWEGLKGGATDLWNGASETAGNAWEGIKGGASDAYDTVADGAGRAVDWAGDTLSSAGSAISSGASKAVSFLTSW